MADSSVGSISNSCGAVTVEAGTSVTVGDFISNGGIVHLGSTATQLAVDGPVEVTHATKIALAKRPTCRTPLKLISWPAAQSAPDTSLLALVKPDGSSWGEKCALTIETEDDVTYLTAHSPMTGTVFIFR